jgi:hypothetical protein
MSQAISCIVIFFNSGVVTRDRCLTAGNSSQFFVTFLDTNTNIYICYLRILHYILLLLINMY